MVIIIITSIDTPVPDHCLVDKNVSSTESLNNVWLLRKIMTKFDVIGQRNGQALASLTIYEFLKM